MKRERKSNMELLRIFAMLCIILHHIVRHGIYMNLSEDLLINTTFLQAMFFGGKFGVIIFILLSGYFLINQEFKFSKFTRLILQYLFYNVIFLFIATKFNIIKFDYKLLITAVFPLTGFCWFANAYILLYIFFPFLNKLIKSLKKTEIEIFILLGGVIWFLFPTIALLFNIQMKMEFSNAILFVYIYSIGAYINLFYSNRNFKCAGKIALISYFGYVILQVLCYRYGDYWTISKSVHLNSNPYFLAQQSSVIILLTSITVFLYFKSTSINKNIFINRVSSTVFGVYLIHDNDCFRRFIWNVLLDVKFHYTQPYFILYVICLALTILSVCSVIDYFRYMILEKGLFEKYEESLDQFFCFHKNKLLKSADCWDYFFN